MKLEDVRIGYLLVNSPVPNTYIGGVMIVDYRGLPVEFRYTEPIQPTKIQQILYGAVLGRYIKSTVILETVLRSLEHTPHVMVVSDDAFLDRHLVQTDYPVIRLTETKSPPLKSALGFERIQTTEYLLQLTPETNPVRVQLQQDVVLPVPASATKSLPDKSGTPEGDFSQTELYHILTHTGRIMDILEPMKRVEKALGALCQEAGIKTNEA